MVLGGYTWLLSISSSEQTSGLYCDLLLGTDTSAHCRCTGMGLPKPTRLSLTQFPNSCSFSQPQSQWFSSCIDHLSKDRLDLNHTGIFLARVQNLINLYQAWERATYPDKMTAIYMCFAALADCWAVTLGSHLGPRDTKALPSLSAENFPKTQSTLSLQQQTLGSLSFSVTSETPSIWSPFFPFTVILQSQSSQKPPPGKCIYFAPSGRLQNREMCISNAKAKSVQAVFFGFLWITTLVECKEKTQAFALGRDKDKGATREPGTHVA